MPRPSRAWFLPLALLAGGAQAADWLALQGTEPPGADSVRFVGYLQALYQHDFSAANALNQYVPPKVIGPELERREQFTLASAGLGVRGAPAACEGRLNYALSLEFGRNGATWPGEVFATPLEASLTLNQVAGAHLRAGLFKTPGAEEGLQAVSVADYISLSEAVNGLVLERFPTRHYTANVPPQELPAATPLNAFDRPTGAFRDIGVELFDTLHGGGAWELSYALMLGQGNGLKLSDPDSNWDRYLYLAAERVDAGQGPRREGLKLFAWGQWGSRLLDDRDDGLANPARYDRNRAGLGVRYLNKPLRLSAEYIYADGMVFVGPDKPTFVFTRPENGSGADSRGQGGYLEAGWTLPGTAWTLSARYDTLLRLTDRPDQHRLDKWTLAAQWQLPHGARLDIDYEFRDFRCDSGQPGCTGPNANLKGVGDRVGVMLSVFF